MILPTKHMGHEMALLSIAAEIYHLCGPRESVGSLWDKYKNSLSSQLGRPPVSYDWFLLALDLLFILGRIDLRGKMIVRPDHVR